MTETDTIDSNTNTTHDPNWKPNNWENYLLDFEIQMLHWFVQMMDLLDFETQMLDW